MSCPAELCPSWGGRVTEPPEDSFHTGATLTCSSLSDVTRRSWPARVLALALALAHPLRHNVNSTGGSSRSSRSGSVDPQPEVHGLLELPAHLRRGSHPVRSLRAPRGAQSDAAGRTDLHGDRGPDHICSRWVTQCADSLGGPAVEQ